jgi:phosphoenolpyruvate carboxylase
MMSQIYQLQSHTYQVVVYTWNSTSTNIKNEVKQFAKDIVLANADIIEQTIKEVAKTTVFSAIIIAISNKLVEELYPILLDVRSYSDQLRMTTQHIQELSESITNAKCDIHLLENNSELNQKLEAISMQIDYLRTIQPSPFNEIMNSLSIFASPSMTDVFAKVTGTIGSSASQQGRTRIDNM